MDKISVIIPVYNTDKYLPRCLDSIINNDYKELEIICVNDGSTDNSLNILKQYKEKDNRIKLIDIQNQGVSMARNIGLDNATGDCIAFIDSDDWIHKQYFSVLMHFKNKYKANVVSVTFKSTDCFAQDAPIEIDNIKSKSYIGEDALNNVNIRWIVWGKVFEREILSESRFIAGINYGEDTVFMIENYLGNKTIKTVIASSNLYYYYKRNTSASSENTVLKNIDLCKLFLERMDSLKDKHSAWPYVADSIRRCLSYRYRVYRSDGENKYLDDIEWILRQNLVFERKYRCLPFWKSIVFRLMIRVPKLFEIYHYVRK